MGLMDHINEGLKKADDKLGTVVDGGKAEVDISKEESKIRDSTRDIGKKIVEYLDAGNTLEDQSIMDLYKSIVESRKKIEELKAQQEEYKKKL
jgi:hypothetical protein